MDARHTLKCDIYKLDRLESNVMDTLGYNDDADFLYPSATALGMRPNHECRCECIWQTNGINKTATSDRLDHCWQLGFQWHRKGIELVYKSLDCLTVRPFFVATNVFFVSSFFFWGVGVGGWVGGGMVRVAAVCVWAYLDLVGEHSAPIYLLFGAVYWSLGRRWYFGVSNVALVVEVFVLSGFGLSIVILCVWVVSFSAYYMEFYAFIFGLPYPFCRFVVFIYLPNKLILLRTTVCIFRHVFYLGLFLCPSWPYCIPQGLYSLRRHRLIDKGIPIINLKRSSVRCRFIIEIPILEIQRLLSE